MTTTPPRRPVIPAPITELLGSPRFASALSLVAVATAFCTNLLRSTMGWGGLLGILGALALLAAFSLVAHRGMIEWQGILPISIIVFVAWCGVSIFWSEYQWATLAAIIYQVTFAFLGVYVALVRDTIQVVRAVGDALRALLALSLAVEVLAGLLIDRPIHFLGVAGDLALGGPIQGIFATRNQLGLVALIAFVTFLIEWRTRSVRRMTALLSVALAAVCLVFSRSPVIVVVSVVVLLAILALYGMRKLKAEHRLYGQVTLGVIAAAALVAAYLARVRIIEFLSAQNVLNVRYSVWIQVWDLIPVHQLQGWGWIGFWRDSLPPYSIVDAITGAPHANALNAFLDVYLQVGLIGLILFAAFVALAFSRSWILASNKRSVVYAWAPLIILVIVTTSMAESVALVEVGWMLLVVCAVKAAQGMSWRNALPSHTPMRAEEGLG